MIAVQTSRSGANRMVRYIPQRNPVPRWKCVAAPKPKKCRVHVVSLIQNNEEALILAWDFSRLSLEDQKGDLGKGIAVGIKTLIAHGVRFREIRMAARKGI